MGLGPCPQGGCVEGGTWLLCEGSVGSTRSPDMLSASYPGQEHKVLLTGTPLQNTVEELFSLLHFLEPSQFPSEAEFLKDFGDLKTEEQVRRVEGCSPSLPAQPMALLQPACTLLAYGLSFLPHPALHGFLPKRPPNTAPTRRPLTQPGHLVLFPMPHNS